MPESSPAVQLRRIFLRNNAGDFSVERCMRRIVERAQHSGHIAQGRVLDAPFADRAPGISFEINKDKIPAGEQYLAEVHIAMNACADRRDAVIAQRLETCAQLV